jgi:hypothetical protein
MASSSAPSSSGRNMALTAAFLGWLFDGFEMGLFPLIGSPALADLLKVEPGNPVVLNWFNVILATFLLHLRHLHRPLRPCHGGLAHRRAALRGLARHGR